mgnify:CR=1 FL=1
MALLKNTWFIPILAMLIALTVSMTRVYYYVSDVMRGYVSTFHVDTEDYFVYWTFHSREIQRLIDSLKEKDEKLKAKETDLTSWETRLQNEKTELKKIKEELEAFRNSLSTLIVQTSADEAKNLKTLSSTYATMDPASAVEILNEMDENTVVKILALMKPDVVSPIFENMARTPGMEAQMRARIARLTEKLRLYKL